MLALILQKIKKRLGLGKAFYGANADGKVIVRSYNELRILIIKTIESQGPFCDLNFIDVSRIDDMSFLFAGSLFDGDISSWNVSRVKNMSHMFYNLNERESPRF